MRLRIGEIKKLPWNNKNELEAKNYPKNKQPIIHQQKLKPPNCLSCKQNIWLEVDQARFGQNREYIINKQKHQIDKIS